MCKQRPPHKTQGGVHLQARCGHFAKVGAGRKGWGQNAKNIPPPKRKEESGVKTQMANKEFGVMFDVEGDEEVSVVGFDLFPAYTTDNGELIIHHPNPEKIVKVIVTSDSDPMKGFEARSEDDVDDK